MLEQVPLLHELWSMEDPLWNKVYPEGLQHVERLCAGGGQKCEEKRMAQSEMLCIDCKPSSCVAQQVVKKSRVMK